MAYISQIEPSEATGEVADFYSQFAEVPGGVPGSSRSSAATPTR